MAEVHSSVVAVNEVNFEDEVLKSELPVFIDVSAEWCGPCKAAAPVVEAIAMSRAGKLKVALIDGGESPHLVAKLGVRGFPTFLGVVAGRVVRTRAGFAGKRALEALSDEILALGGTSFASPHACESS